MSNYLRLIRNTVSSNTIKLFYQTLNTLTFAFAGYQLGCCNIICNVIKSMEPEEGQTLNLLSHSLEILLAHLYESIGRAIVLTMSHIMQKCVFGNFRPGKIQTSLLSCRS